MPKMWRNFQKTTHVKFKYSNLQLNYNSNLDNYLPINSFGIFIF